MALLRSASIDGMFFLIAPVDAIFESQKACLKAVFH